LHATLYGWGKKELASNGKEKEIKTHCQSRWRLVAPRHLTKIFNRAWKKKINGREARYVCKKGAGL